MVAARHRFHPFPPGIPRQVVSRVLRRRESQRGEIKGKPGQRDRFMERGGEERGLLFLLAAAIHHFYKCAEETGSSSSSFFFIVF